MQRISQPLLSSRTEEHDDRAPPAHVPSSMGMRRRTGLLRQMRSLAVLGVCLLLAAGLLYILALHWLSPATRLVYALVYALLCVQVALILLLAGYCARPRLALAVALFTLLASALFFYYAHGHYARFSGARCTVATCWLPLSPPSRPGAPLRLGPAQARSACPVSYALSVDTHARTLAARERAQSIVDHSVPSPSRDVALARLVASRARTDRIIHGTSSSSSSFSVEASERKALTHVLPLRVPAALLTPTLPFDLEESFLWPRTLPIFIHNESTVPADRRCSDTEHHAFSHPICTTPREIARVLSTHYRVVDHVEDACLIVIPSVPSSDRGCRQLTSLAGWNDGRFHVVFDMRDRYWPSAPLLSEWAAEIPLGIGSAHARCDLGRALSVKSSMASTFMRAHFDVVLPLFQLRHTDLPSAPPGLRERLAVFAGTLGSSPHKVNLRKQLFALNQTLPGVLIQEYTDGPSYDALLRSSTFGLVLAGRGLHSYRLLETMNHGTIPVIIDDLSELPLSEVLDWTQFSVRISPRSIKHVPRILEALAADPQVVLRLQTNLLFVYQRYLSSVERFVLAAFDLVVHHLYESRISQVPLIPVSSQVQRILNEVIQ